MFLYWKKNTLGVGFKQKLMLVFHNQAQITCYLEETFPSFHTGNLTPLKLKDIGGFLHTHSNYTPRRLQLKFRV